MEFDVFNQIPPIIVIDEGTHPVSQMDVIFEVLIHQQNAVERTPFCHIRISGCLMVLVIKIHPGYLKWRVMSLAARSS
jgi:hypothetical protein